MQCDIPIIGLELVNVGDEIEERIINSAIQKSQDHSVRVLVVVNLVCSHAPPHGVGHLTPRA